MLCFSAVAGVWDFTTSGLETGLLFGWLGLTWWLLVRVLDRHSGTTIAATCASVGVTIRPELFLYTLAFGTALFVLETRYLRPRSGLRRYLVLGAALFGVPLLSEIFRVAYFGLLVSNTALTKSAFSIWWPQGWVYFLDFTQTYWLWIPVLTLSLIAAKRLHTWWIQGSRLESLVLLTPVIPAVVNVVYVIAIGGDFMHARMLLPGFFGIALALWIDPFDKFERLLPLGVILVWFFVALSAFRQQQQFIGANGISNERVAWINLSGNPHPITPTDFAHSTFAEMGQQLSALATRDTTKEIALMDTDVMAVPAQSGLPEIIYGWVLNIGLAGLAAGPNVYVFDGSSLANPIGSHFTVTHHGRPGHEKVTSVTWMLARFGLSDEANLSGTSATSVQIARARRALSCQPLSGYLHAVTSPLGLDQIVSNFAHAFTWTTMKYSADPVLAEEQLCASG